MYPALRLFKTKRFILNGYVNWVHLVVIGGWGEGGDMDFSMAFACFSYIFLNSSMHLGNRRCGHFKWTLKCKCVRMAVRLSLLTCLETVTSPGLTLSEGSCRKLSYKSWSTYKGCTQKTKSMLELIKNIMWGKEH